MYIQCTYTCTCTCLHVYTCYYTRLPDRYTTKYMYMYNIHVHVHVQCIAHILYMYMCMYTCIISYRDKANASNDTRRQLFFSREKEELPRAGLKPAMFCVLGRPLYQLSLYTCTCTVHVQCMLCTFKVLMYSLKSLTLSASSVMVSNMESSERRSRT